MNRTRPLMHRVRNHRFSVALIRLWRTFSAWTLVRRLKKIQALEVELNLMMQELEEKKKLLAQKLAMNPVEMERRRKLIQVEIESQEYKPALQSLSDLLQQPNQNS